MQGGRTGKRLRAIAARAGLALLPAFLPAQAQAAATRRFSVTTTRIGSEGHPDFYAQVFINGVEYRTPRVDDVSDVDPDWAISTELPDTIEDVPVGIQIWDYDTTTGDDLGDAGPQDDDSSLDLTASYADGRWRDTGADKTDNVNWPQSCSSGDGEAGSGDDGPSVEVCFDVSTTSTGGDGDGDGLLDGWELNGYHPDGSGRHRSGPAGDGSQGPPQGRLRHLVFAPDRPVAVWPHRRGGP
ncbi:hypothetical protein [Streptomyces virginiae]